MEIVNFRVRPTPGAGAGAGFWLMVIAGGMVFGSDLSRADFAARARADCQRAQARYQADTDNPEAARQFARAAFDCHDFVTNNAQRAELALQGIAACRHVVERNSNSVPGHYYLGLELGRLADTKRNVAGLKLVREMEREFRAADTLDEHYDYAGPARCLGLLYRDAPGWPMSIGSRRRAREWLERAVKLEPDYPENRLYLAESYWQWKDREAAGNELKRLDALWPSARTNFTGEAWEYSWVDWSARRDAVREKIDAAQTKKPKNSGD